MIIELGRITAETKGADQNKRYEPIAVEPFCVDTGAQATTGSKNQPDCSS